MSRDVATRRVYRPFIVKGPAAWTESWHAPRYAGGFHLHEGQDVLCRDGAPVLAATAGRGVRRRHARRQDRAAVPARRGLLVLRTPVRLELHGRQRLPGRTRRCDRVLRELGRRGRRADARPLRTLSPVGAGRGHDVRPHRLARGGRTPCRRLRATRRGGQVDDHGRSDLPHELGAESTFTVSSPVVTAGLSTARRSAAPSATDVLALAMVLAARLLLIPGRRVARRLGSLVGRGTG